MAGRSPLPSAPTRSPQRRQELEDRRRVLLRSIEDLDTEREAGDIAEVDYRTLRDRYVSQAAAVLRALQGETDPAAMGVEEAEAAPDLDTPTAPTDASVDTGAPAPTGRRRRLLLWGAVTLFAAAAIVLVVTEVASRLPGEQATGSITLSRSGQLQRTLVQAEVLESEGKDAEALTLYHQVLESDPTQEQALAETGWLEFEAGVVAKKGSLLSDGQGEEQDAERADPTGYAPHLYLGSMLLVEGRFEEAAGEYSQFLADDPPVSLEQTAWPYVERAFEQAHETVPPTPAGVKG